VFRVNCIYKQEEEEKNIYFAKSKQLQYKQDKQTQRRVSSRANAHRAGHPLTFYMNINLSPLLPGDHATNAITLLRLFVHIARADPSQCHHSPALQWHQPSPSGLATAKKSTWVDQSSYTDELDLQLHSLRPTLRMSLAWRRALRSNYEMTSKCGDGNGRAIR